MIINIEDLSNTSKILQDFFDKYKNSSRTLRKKIDAFCNANDFKQKFQGSGYDSARQYMSVYITALNKLESLCDATSNNIISANNSVMRAMEGYTQIDLSIKNELQIKLNQINKDINYYYSELNKIDDNLNDSSKNNYNQLINEATIKRKEIETFLKVIENTEIAYNNAKNIIGGDVSTIIESYTKSVEFFCN